MMEVKVRARSNETIMAVEHHPTLLDARRWQDLKIFIQHRAKLCGKQCCLALFEQAITYSTESHMIYCGIYLLNYITYDRYQPTLFVVYYSIFMATT